MSDFENAQQSENFAKVFGKFHHCISANVNIELTPDEVRDFMNGAQQMAANQIVSKSQEKTFDFPEFIGGDDEPIQTKDEYLVYPPPPSSPLLMATPIKRVMNILRAENLETFSSELLELQNTLPGFDCVSDVNEVKGECVMIYSYFEEITPVSPTN